MKKIKRILGIGMFCVGYVVVFVSSPVCLQGLMVMICGITWTLNND